MEGKEELYQQIEDYLDGKMSGSEQVDFQARIDSEPELAGEVIIHADLAKGLNDPGVDQLRSTLKQVMRRQSPQPTILVFKRYYKHLVAACIVLILAVIGIVQLTPRATPQELFAQYFEPYPDILTSRDAADWGPKLLGAMALYNQQDYAGASALFKEAIDSGVENDLLLFYYGVSELGQGHGEKAVQILSQDIDGLIDSDGQWYLALAYLENGDKPGARRVLRNLAEADSRFSDQAGSLVEELGK